MTRLAAAFARPPADPRPDRALLAAFLTDRDEPAFAELVRRHGPLVWATCRRALPDPADAEDAFQATFLVLVRRADRLAAADSLGPWLYRVAAWTGRALRRKNARRRAVVGPLPDVVADPRVTITFELDDLLLALPDRYRSAVVLCHLQGLTHREAADRLGCAEGTVASLVSRALAKLRAKLGREPAAVLALAVAAAVPAELSAGAVRSAVAFQLTTLSAAAPPAVVHLTEGVLRMFWVKKAAGVAAAMVLVAGLGIGVSVRNVPQAIAADPMPAPQPPRAADELERIRAELELVRQKAELGDLELKRLAKQADELQAQFRTVTANRDELAKRYKDLLTAREALEKSAPRAEGGRPAESAITINLTGRSDTPILVVETAAGGKILWEVGIRQAKPGDLAELRAYLTRAARDKDAPKQIAIIASKDLPAETVRAVVKVCDEAGFRGKVSAEMRDLPSSRLPGDGGDRSLGEVIGLKLTVGQTARVRVLGGRDTEFVPAAPEILKFTADAEGLNITGLKPGQAELPVRSRDGRVYVFRVDIEPPAKSGASGRPPAPARKVDVGGDGPPGGEFHVNLKIGETVRVNVHGGRINDPIPTPPYFLKMAGDADGLIVVGVDPGITRVTVRDTKGREHVIRIEVTEVAKP